MGYVTLTREGRDKLVRELEILKGEKRREVAKALAEARAHGDLSENAEYDAAKEAQAHNEKKIGEIEDILIRARIMDDSVISPDEALLGAKVKVIDKETREEFEYMLVAEEESDFAENKISVTSPVGKALLGHKKGDVVEISAPVGTISYEITGISR
jgi:transcription elongation factor GreA